MRLSRNWFRPKDQIRPVFHVIIKLQTSVQSILVSIFRLGLLRLSESTDEATSSKSVNVVSHLERFQPSSFQLGNVQKAFLLSLGGK